MAERARQDITMLDGAALVTGAAVASVHLREFTEEMVSQTLFGWVFLCGAFALLAITSAGPFVYLVRRFSRRPEGYPQVGDRLWLAYGLPWLVAALIVSASGSTFDASASLYVQSLFLALYAASGLGIWWLVIAKGEQSNPKASRSWTDLIGRGLSVAWPLQIGLGFVVTR